MANNGIVHIGRIRLILFAAVAILHITVILNVVVPMNPAVIKPAKPAARVMKLVDVQEDIPDTLPRLLPPEESLPPPKPVSPQASPPATQTVTPTINPPPSQSQPAPDEQGAVSESPPGTQELIAETMVETEKTPLPAVIGGGRSETGTGTGAEQIVYLPQYMVTDPPVLPDSDIAGAMVYPPIARRANIEGNVYLELFIDQQGNIRHINILQENPPKRGFGDAAINAFKGIKAKPAETNGEPVAVRYRYPIRFTLK
ncbi:MAG: energy transducer TonB [Treponema sp.]|nr:energy transducer TonB [Treponema sp.]